MDNERKRCKQLIKEYQTLLQQVREILIEEDPVGIYFGCNPDEYDPEVGSILPRLSCCENINDVRQVVYEEFLRWFGAETAGTANSYQRIAERIWAVISN